MGLMAMLEEVLNSEVATATPAIPATHKPQTPPTVARVATVAVAGSPNHETARTNLRLVHTARTEQEAALYAERLQSFQGKGIANDSAAAVAVRLVERDRQLDDRRSCAECDGFYAGRCKHHLSPIGESTMQTLHRCKRFTPELSEGKQTI